jgi:phthiocerol/phenolphthiocerol synthesis type-I polyketide synthase D
MHDGDRQEFVQNERATPDQATLAAWLRYRVAACTDTPVDLVSTELSFAEQGISSRDALVLLGELQELVGTSIAPELLWDHPSIDRLSAFLAGQAQTEVEATGPAPGSSDPVAIIGMGCRFPGANGPDELWQLLLTAADPRMRVPNDRERRMGAGSHILLDDVEGFDHRFFAIAPAEIAEMDPQQRMLLEVAWETFEHAGIVPSSLVGSDTGVVIGISSGDFARTGARAEVAASRFAGTGQAFSIAANRLSYFFRFSRAEHGSGHRLLFQLDSCSSRVPEHPVG